MNATFYLPSAFDKVREKPEKDTGECKKARGKIVEI